MGVGESPVQGVLVQVAQADVLLQGSQLLLPEHRHPWCRHSIWLPTKALRKRWQHLCWSTGSPGTADELAPSSLGRGCLQATALNGRMFACQATCKLCTWKGYGPACKLPRDRPSWLSRGGQLGMCGRLPCGAAAAAKVEAGTDSICQGMRRS